MIFTEEEKKIIDKLNFEARFFYKEKEDMRIRKQEEIEKEKEFQNRDIFELIQEQEKDDNNIIIKRNIFRINLNNKVDYEIKNTQLEPWVLYEILYNSIKKYDLKILKEKIKIKKIPDSMHYETNVKNYTVFDKKCIYFEIEED